MVKFYYMFYNIFFQHYPCSSASLRHSPVGAATRLPRPDNTQIINLFPWMDEFECNWTAVVLTVSGWRLGDPPRHCCCKTMQFQTNLRDKYFATRSGSWLSEPSDLHRQDWKHSYGVIMTRESSRDSNTLQLYTLPNSAIHHPFFAEIHTSPLAMVYSIGRVFDRMLSVVSMLSYFMAAPE